MPVVQELCQRTVIIDRGRVVTDDGLSFTAELPQATDLFRLTDWLRDADAAVDAISRVTVDFEQVFWRLVNHHDLNEHGLKEHDLNGHGVSPTGTPEGRDGVA